MTFYDEFFYRNQREIKNQLFNWVLSSEPQVFATLTFNQYASLDRARTALSRFHKRVDKKLYGKDFHKVSPQKRTFFIAFPEHITSNLHYHLLIKPPQNHESRYIAAAERVWTKICLPGDIKLSQIENEDDIRATSYYSLKDSFKIHNYENFILSNEFLHS